MGGQRDVDDAPLITEYGFETSLTNFEGLGERVLPRFKPRKNGKPYHHLPTQMSAEFGGGSIHWAPRHKVTESFVDRSIEEIRTAVTKSQPFYVNLWLDDVHGPVQAPPALRGDGSREAHYLGVMKEMDRQLGRVFEFIQSTPALRDNTIVLLASDNGPEAGLGSSGDLRGEKCLLYEGGIRSPLIVWYGSMPASARGSMNEQTVLAGIDFPPSLLALANVPRPAGVDFDGLNMVDTLVGRAHPNGISRSCGSAPPIDPAPTTVGPIWRFVMATGNC